MSTIGADLVSREVAYVIEDVVLAAPFEVYTTANAWWMDRVKVERLMSAFKSDLTIMEACISAGITYDQYKYFNKVHPEFSTVKERCASALPMIAKRGLVNDLADPKAWRSRQWYLERRQPETYGNQKANDVPIPDGGSVLTTTAQAFFDAKGRPVLSRQMMERIQKHGAGKPTSDSAPVE